MATESQVKAVAGQVCEAIKLADMNRDEIVTTNNRLMTLSDETNQRLNNMGSTIGNINNCVKETRAELIKLSGDLYRAVFY